MPRLLVDKQSVKQTKSGLFYRNNSFENNRRRLNTVHDTSEVVHAI